MSNDNNNKAATVLGTIGTVLWCIQLIPQIIRNYRYKNCEGLPPIMMFLWALSGVPFGVYFIVQRSNLPVQVQPHIFMLFATITWIQCLYYPPIKWERKKLIVVVTTVCLLFAGIEIALVLPLRPVFDRGVTWPITLVGAIAAVLLALGLVPPYFEIKQHHGEVVGINFIFLGMDCSGALFSILSLVAQGGDIDIMGIVLYCIVIVLEFGIFGCHIFWVLTHREVIKQRKLDKAAEAEKKKAEAEAEAAGVTGGNTTSKRESFQLENDIEKKSATKVTDEEKMIETTSN